MHSLFYPNGSKLFVQLFGTLECHGGFLNRIITLAPEITISAPLKQPTLSSSKRTINHDHLLTFRRTYVCSAVAKTALGDQKIALNREHKRYQNPVVASSQHIRALLDVVGERDHNLEPDEELDEIEPLSLILEWMENDLRSVSSAPFRAGSPLPKVIAPSQYYQLLFL
ncbi:hypothetical protein OCU04_007289 [Sclerotinia nivalis]|uniref:Uncharacterized protein n=1 Tax=Sclerotinia nivalis TaxID=352851 RepID=A0A9X0ALL3_9HELO|nr:hypothetical protein OCU04_007289 [Sclerotinia nivalis]